MRRLDRVLIRVSERGDPLGAELLIDHLERKLAGEPDSIVVARHGSDIMLTSEEQTNIQPEPPVRRRGLAVALASFLMVLVVGGGIWAWVALDDGDSETTASPSTTQAPSSTQAPSTTEAVPPVADAIGTFVFDGTDWTYRGPTTFEAGEATFSVVNASSENVVVFSWFGLGDDEVEEELAATPVGTAIGSQSSAPPPPPSDFFEVVEAAPGETVSAKVVMGPGPHLIDAATGTLDAIDELWRIALFEVTQPESSPIGEVVGTFTFDGTTWTYEGPTSLEAGTVTFSLVNTSEYEVAVYSFYGLEGEELEAQLAVYPIGTAVGPMALAAPVPPGNYLVLFEVAPGETVSASAVLGATNHLIDAEANISGSRELWRVALIEVAQP